MSAKFKRRVSRVPIGLAAALTLIAALVDVQAQRPADTPDRWEPTIKEFEEADRLNPPPQGGIVFVGSSGIVRWDLQEFFPELGDRTINRGFGGSLLADAARYADRIVTPYKPHTVVLYAGDNDIGRGGTADQVFDRFVQFVNNVRAELPDVRIIVISIKPSLLRWEMIDNIRAANAKIKDYSVENGVIFVDIEPQSLGADGKPRAELLVEDGLHMTPEGYRVWTAAVRPHLR